MGIADHIKNGISRRGFVLGGAAAGAATVLAGCSKKTGTSDDAAGRAAGYQGRFEDCLDH